VYFSPEDGDTMPLRNIGVYLHGTGTLETNVIIIITSMETSNITKYVPVRF
jgi:hypothetical protein